jgi:hypothetical protein
MDWNKLQHTLFELDPSDPREDLAKLQATAQGGNSAPAAKTVDYLQESAEVTEGSLQMDRDYSVNDFAALAGVRIDEKQKMGSAGQAKGKDPMPKAEPGRTKHPLKDKLVGEESIDKVAQLESRVAYLESVIETLLEGKTPKKPAMPNPVAKHMNTYNKASVVPDKKKDAKAGKQKHKGQQYESIADELWKKLNALSKS